MKGEVEFIENTVNEITQQSKKKIKRMDSTECSCDEKKLTGIIKMQV